MNTQQANGRLNGKKITVSKEGNFSRSSRSLLKDKSVRKQIDAFAKVPVKKALS